MKDINKLFEDVDIAPFMDSLRQLVSVFASVDPALRKPLDTSHSFANALRDGIGGAFTTIFKAAAKVAPLVKHFLLDVMIFGLNAYIRLKPMIRWFQDMLKNKAVMATLTQAFEGLKTAAMVVGVVIGLVVAGLAAFMAISFVAGAAVWAVVGSIIGLSAAISQKLLGLVGDAVTWGKDFVSGLINGITGGASSVVNAVKGLADSAKNTFKSALGIASPSKEMMKLGAFAGAGVAEGLDASTKDVGYSAGSVGAATIGGAASGASSGASAKGGSSITNTFNINVGGDGKSASELTEEMLSLCFERMALAQGL